MHWPSTWADEFNALPAVAAVPSTFNVTTGIYIDGPEPTGQRLRDAYRQQTNIGLTRYIDGFLGASHQLKIGFENWWTPTGTDVFNIFDDLRLRYTGAAGGLCNATVRTGCVPSEVFVYNTPLTQKTQMRNFAAFMQDRLSYQRFTLNLGLRWSYYSTARSRRRATAAAVVSRAAQRSPEVEPPYTWNTFAPRTGIVWKLTEDGKNVVKASYSRYYESMYTTEFNAINRTASVTTGVATYAWTGGSERQRHGRSAHCSTPTARLRAGHAADAQVHLRAEVEHDRSEPEGSEERRNHVRVPAGAREQLVAERGLDPALVQRLHRRSELLRPALQHGRVDRVRRRPASVTDSGPDNLAGTGDDER